MLKIYLRTVEYEIHNEDKIGYLFSNSDYVIRDEEDAYSRTTDFDAYTVEAQEHYIGRCDITQKRKGKTALYVSWDRSIYLQQWKAPNAKLVARLHYKEKPCSMKQLLTLPATDVIAYLKQEGLNFTLTN